MKSKTLEAVLNFNEKFKLYNHNIVLGVLYCERSREATRFGMTIARWRDQERKR